MVDNKLQLVLAKSLMVGKMQPSNLAFVQKVSAEGCYQYFAIPKPPILGIRFKYQNATDCPADVKDKCYSSYLESIHLSWDQDYPTNWPVEEEETFLAWLSKECNNWLKQEQ
jgi:hypothetical protein